MRKSAKRPADVEELESKTPEMGASAFIPAPLEAIASDIPLPYPLYLKVSGHYVQFRAKGDVLSGRRVESLAAQHLDSVFIPKSAWDDFVHQLEGEEEKIELSERNSEETITRVRNLLMMYGKSVEEQKDLHRAMYGKLQDLGFRLALGIQSNPKLATSMLRRFGEPTLYYANHSINVAIYSIAVAMKMGMPISEIQLLAFAALIHNVGNIFVPQDILYKPTALTPAEWEAVHKHPFQGAKLLEEFRAPKEVLLVAKQHHERANGSGYPVGLAGVEIHPFARIVHIADFYDALTQAKPYRVGIPPERALLVMKHDKSRFDPKILSFVTETDKTT